MKKIVLAGFVSVLMFASCNDNASKSTAKVIASNEKEALEKNEIPDLSLFNLSTTWTTQNAKDIKLQDLQGDVLVMVMIYTSCTTACPRLIADMKNIEERLPKAIKKHVKMVFVSIDPETDTPERLKSFAQDRDMDKEPWLFLRSTEENTREFAAVVAVNYKQINPMTFSHSNIISVFNPQGILLYQQEGLGVNSDETVENIQAAVSEI